MSAPDLHGGSAAPEAREACPGERLPCLNSSNSDKPADPFHEVQSQHRKTAFALVGNVRHFIETYGIEHVGFMTLTFPDHVIDPREAQRRFNNIARRVLKRYRAYIRVLERHESGRIHYHLLVALEVDIRTGTDIGRVCNKHYRAANPALRREWAYLRATLWKYGFGRHELMPVKTNGEGIAKYLGKYISKHIFARKKEDKGIRLVDYSHSGRVCYTRFAWNSPGAWVWRSKLKKLAEMLRVGSMLEMKLRFGRYWAYHMRGVILSMELDFWPSAKEYRVDRGCFDDDFIDDNAVDIRIIHCDIGEKHTALAPTFLLGPASGVGCDLPR